MKSNVIPFFTVVICNFILTITLYISSTEKSKLKEEVCQLKGGTLVEKICVKGGSN